jgi:hypothetical protein
LHEDQGDNSDGFPVDLITIQLNDLLYSCLSRDKYGNVLPNKRTELVDDFNRNYFISNEIILATFNVKKIKWHCCVGVITIPIGRGYGTQSRWSTTSFW